MSEIKPVAWRYRPQRTGQPLVKARAKFEGWCLTQFEGDLDDLAKVRAEIQPLYTEAQVKAREAAAWEAGREASAGAAEHRALWSDSEHASYLYDAGRTIRALTNPYKVP